MQSQRNKFRLIFNAWANYKPVLNEPTVIVQEDMSGQWHWDFTYAKREARTASRARLFAPRNNSHANYRAPLAVEKCGSSMSALMVVCTLHEVPEDKLLKRRILTREKLYSLLIFCKSLAGVDVQAWYKLASASGLLSCDQ